MSTGAPKGKKKKKKLVIDENDNIWINDDDFYGWGIESILSQLRSIPIENEHELQEQIKNYAEKRKLAYQIEE